MAVLRYPARLFEEIEAVLQREYEEAKVSTTLDWETGRLAALAAWYRAAVLSKNLPKVCCASAIRR
ncbi:hypothetical protein ACUHMQ_17495 [Chitinimonas sp. PSY-7]|uniref:hypothetical protein n=1 Tax=Chitinimonas sp. PSY-7 TaxID=3459088 RepID=UPI00403FCFC4